MFPIWQHCRWQLSSWETKIEYVTWQITQELELYDNQIKKLENLSGLVNLKMLDVSHNMLRRIEGLEGLVKWVFHLCSLTWKWKVYTPTVAAKHSKILFFSLERLYLVSNKISKIENLDCCPKLNMLELGDNKIRKVGYISFVELKSYSILPSVKHSHYPLLR